MIIHNGAKYNSIQIVDADLRVVYFGNFIVSKNSRCNVINVIYKGWRIICACFVGSLYINNIMMPGVPPFTARTYRCKLLNILDSNRNMISHSNYAYFKVDASVKTIMNVNLICGGLRRDVYFDGADGVCGNVNYRLLFNTLGSLF